MRRHCVSKVEVQRRLAVLESDCATFRIDGPALELLQVLADAFVDAAASDAERGADTADVPGLDGAGPPEGSNPDAGASERYGQAAPAHGISAALNVQPLLLRQSAKDPIAALDAADRERVLRGSEDRSDSVPATGGNELSVEAASIVAVRVRTSEERAAK